MLEIPEAATLSRQLTDTVAGKEIRSAAANTSPHKLTWYFGDPLSYNMLLSGKRIDSIHALGGNVEIRMGNTRLLLQDGVNLRLLKPGAPIPTKHQLHLSLEDGSSLVGVVQMYGGISAFIDGENQNPYYLVAKEKPSPLTDAFDEAYFTALFNCKGFAKLSAKAFLATEQRIPGLGNGVLQDILYRARLHPKRKMGTLSDAELTALCRAVKQTLAAMAQAGGRDTERDLFGNAGGYVSILSKNTVDMPCLVCGSDIKKEAYLGGSIYYCTGCQPLAEQQ